MKRRTFFACLGATAVAAALPGCTRAPQEASAPSSSAAAAASTAASAKPAAPTYIGTDISSQTFETDFTMQGSDGKQYSLSNFRGKYVMMFFGFTQCPDVCPTALARAVEIRSLLGADGDMVQAVFVTVDPERDTPALLKQYVGAFDPTFLGLAGNAEQTAKIAKNFRIAYRKVPSGSSYTMDHTATTYVIDPEGKPQLTLKHRMTAAECAADLRALMDANPDFCIGTTA